MPAIELTKNRRVGRKTERQNGLAYTDCRLILPEDSDVSGEPGNL